GRAPERAFGEIRGMGITDRFVFYCPQPKSLDRIVSCLLEPAIVESQSLCLAVFEEQFPIVGALQPPPNELADLPAVEARGVDEGEMALTPACVGAMRQCVYGDLGSTCQVPLIPDKHSNDGKYELAKTRWRASHF